MVSVIAAGAAGWLVAKAIAQPVPALVVSGVVAELLYLAALTVVRLRIRFT